MGVKRLFATVDVWCPVPVLPRITPKFGRGTRPLGADPFRLAAIAALAAPVGRFRTFALWIGCPYGITAPPINIF